MEVERGVSGEQRLNQPYGSTKSKEQADRAGRGHLEGTGSPETWPVSTRHSSTAGRQQTGLILEEALDIKVEKATLRRLGSFFGSWAI